MCLKFRFIGRPDIWKSPKKNRKSSGSIWLNGSSGLHYGLCNTNLFQEPAWSNSAAIMPNSEFVQLAQIFQFEWIFSLSEKRNFYTKPKFILYILNFKADSSPGIESKNWINFLITCFNFLENSHSEKKTLWGAVTNFWGKSYRLENFEIPYCIVDVIKL